MGYSWDIRMYRVCVGYVSGMYRESVESDGARGGRCANHGRARICTETRNIYPWFSVGQWSSVVKI